MRRAQEYKALLSSVGYIADDLLATALSLAERLQRPLLLEGEAGVGKTYVARALADAMARPLIRLQCYEGLDAAQTLYEWNYQRQMLAIARAGEGGGNVSEDELFSERYLIKRPLLDAITRETPPVLLIDEIDRADEEFEAFLLEILSEFQVTIPELGVIEAVTRPMTIITSNGIRDLSDALRRRCLYHHIEFPDAATELRIIRARVPECSARLAQTVADFVQALRREDLEKKPGVAETLDWIAALIGLDVENLLDKPDEVHRSLLCVLKTKHDRDQMPMEVFERLAGGTG